jgi:hypothetical protein
MFNCCESVFKVVDDALKSAGETQKKKSPETDGKFKNAFDALLAYEEKKPKKIVAEKRAAAEAKVKSSLKIVNKLKERLRGKKVTSSDHASHILILIDTDPQPSVEVPKQPSVEVPKRIVEFHIHKSLPDRNPTVVKSELAH